MGDIFTEVSENTQLGYSFIQKRQNTQTEADLN